MKVFVTGAAGFIGTQFTAELLKHGHTVLALARSDKSAAAATAAGAEVHRGDLEDVESLKAGARAADGVVHLAFVHDFSDLDRCLRIDQAAIRALGEGLGTSGKPLVIASGTLMMPKGVMAYEDGEPEKHTQFGARAFAEDIVKEFSLDGKVRGSIVRLSPVVHGTPGDHGFVEMFAGASRNAGSVTYIDEGKVRWPAVHRNDAAVLFRLALEKGKAGTVYQAVAEEGVTTKEVMTALGKKLSLPVESKSSEEAGKALGLLGHLLMLDNPASSEKTRREMNWTPTEIGLVEDIQNNYYN